MRAPREAEDNCQGPTMLAVGAEELQNHLVVKKAGDQAFLHRVVREAAIVSKGEAVRIMQMYGKSREVTVVVAEIPGTCAEKTVNENLVVLHRRNGNCSRQARRKRVPPRVGLPLACL